MTDFVRAEVWDRQIIERPWLTVALATLLGVAIDVLVLRHAPGFGASLVGASLAGGVMIGRTFFGLQATRESFVLAAALGFWSLLVSVRAAPALAFLNSIAAVLLLGLMMRLLKREGLLKWTIASYVRSGFATLGGWIVQPMGFLGVDLAERWPESKHRRRAGRMLVGVFLALPLLAVFAALFASADPVFERYLSSLVSIDLDLAPVAGHVGAIVIVAWLAIGSVRYAALPGSDAPDRLRRRLIGVVEAFTVLVLVNALFLVFVVIQSAYLFGGEETLNRAGLTFSEYARRGFFELVVVGSLVIGLILVIDWMVQVGEVRSGSVDVLHGGLVVLTVVVLVSALQRMLLYTEMFGLTELRLYTTVFMGWVFLVLGWAVLTVLRGRRAAFALGAFVSALAVLAVLTLANPAGVIVRTNAQRAGAAPADLDVAYLIELGPDAVPALAAVLDEVEPCAKRSELAVALLQSQEAGRTGSDWRDMTWSRLRADQVLNEAGPRLQSVASASCP